MAMYNVNQYSVDSILTAVKNDQIAIPELQRPFVWNSVKVRDLIDSLYKGYPVGYLITWQSVGAHLKGGSLASSQQILIDGQQRVTSLRAALVGLPVIDKKYKETRIIIAFNPVTEEFATVTPIIKKDPQWIPDISTIFTDTNTYSSVIRYLGANPEVDQDSIANRITRLVDIKNAPIGVISLDGDLDVETVSEVFIRINSKGVPLSSADFAMSKIATYGDRGRNLRKLIDYFSHLSVSPHVYSDIENNDLEFAATSYLDKIKWLKNNNEDIYDPKYGDIIRVAGLVGFSRGRASAIVAELSGRDPETRKVVESRIPVAFDRLEDALLKIVTRFEFENFLMIVKSAGFITPKMISSQNALNFAYALYIRLRTNNQLSEGERKRIVRKWFVMSLLTGRSSGSFEATWEQDIRRIEELGAAEHLAQIEASELSQSFWDVTLPNNLETTSTGSPYFQAFCASQIVAGSKGFLSKSITVAAMSEHSGDIHHLVPKNYLKRHGYTDRVDYNQVANFALTETSINIAIRDQAPSIYMARLAKQIETGVLDLGEIANDHELSRNLLENAIPPGFSTVDAHTYSEFLVQRRRLMATLIRDYYLGL